METKQPKQYVPGLAGVPAVRSSISRIDGTRGLLSYRGIPIEQLAAHSTFAETAYLLIHGRLPTAAQLSAWDQRLRRHRGLHAQVLDVVRALPRTGHPMKALQAGAAVLGMLQPAADRRPEQAPRATAGSDGGAARDVAIVRLLAQLPTLVAAFHRCRRGEDPIEPREELDPAANFLWMLSGKEPDAFSARVMDVCLILHAEHTINASTFGALVAASTLADPYCAVSSAMGALAGRLHGGANERVLAMLREIGSARRVPAYVDRTVASGDRIMGVGHRVYSTKDPRATILQSLATQLLEKLGGARLYDIAREVERVVAERLGPRGIYPNVDFYSGIVYDGLGIPTDLFTPIFAIARVAGWLAHWVEQVQDNKLFRPTQIYVGELEAAYVPLAARG